LIFIEYDLRPVNVSFDLLNEFPGAVKLYFIPDSVDKKDIQIFPVDAFGKVQQINLYGKLFIGKSGVKTDI